MPKQRPRWWTELLLILVAYGAYSGARLLARGDVTTAVDNGLSILRLERALWLHAEEPLNELFTQEPWLGVPSSFAYASLHYVVTPIVLVWLFHCRPSRYRLMRTWLLTSTMLGLIGFTLMPTSPPRLLPGGHGFVDSLAQYSGWGWWADDASAPSGMGDFTNQYAAMPSLHVGWSVWCGVALWHYGGRSLWVRAAAVLYPLITVIVVMGTANHYFLDALAGTTVMVVGLLLARPLLLLSGRLRSPFGWDEKREAAPDYRTLPTIDDQDRRPRRREMDDSAGASAPATPSRVPRARHNGTSTAQESQMTPPS
ncbi:phosphatase PAP2 family protein [Streptomyces triticirhizae]|uniref:Phosphatase PAP2 family protein n=1 Tax=Streptomyces triticirhizae TaxID=2483353 RepID=A0A3M2LZ50_9ACTN|nr:phosphatase PAP2 family protein [Streptomyces triticirhizae]RMI42751.1 phosphatase PAP2 family protein [Streptomyces triticirhizae]